MEISALFAAASAFGVGSIVTAVVVSYLQRSADEAKYRRQKETELRERAFEFYEYLSSLMARRIYRMRRVYYSLREGISIDPTDAIKEYGDVVTEWNDNLAPVLAKLEVYFGHGVYKRFENEIVPLFVKTGSLCERLYRANGEEQGADLYSRILE